MFLVLTACSSAHVKVMSSVDGINKIAVADVERDSAESQALKSAKKYCKEKHQQAVIVSEKTEYRGTMDENQRNLIRKASKAAYILSKSGSGVETAGEVGGMMTSDKDYETEIQFKCE